VARGETLSGRGIAVRLIPLSIRILYESSTMAVLRPGQAHRVCVCQVKSNGASALAQSDLPRDQVHLSAGKFSARPGLPPGTWRLESLA
jgi:hypothetical protein